MVRVMVRFIFHRGGRVEIDGNILKLVWWYEIHAGKLAGFVHDDIRTDLRPMCRVPKGAGGGGTPFHPVRAVRNPDVIARAPPPPGVARCPKPKMFIRYILYNLSGNNNLRGYA